MASIEEQYYARALRLASKGEFLLGDLNRVMVDEKDEGRRMLKSAAWRMLIDAIETIRYSPAPASTAHDVIRHYWLGKIEQAMRTINGCELAMYDPRSHPERYDLPGDEA